MDSQYNNIKAVPFTEYSALRQEQSKKPDLDIVIDGEISLNDYCTALFIKIFEIGLSELNAFLKYQCRLYKDPVLWLNSLEKLMKVNVKMFGDVEQHQRHIKLISLIDNQRDKLLPNPDDDSKPKKSCKKVNGFSDDKEFNFESVLLHLKTLETTAEKILYLNAQITDYRIHPPDYECKQLEKFDEQCRFMIGHLKNEEDLLQQVEAQKLAKIDSIVKFPVNAELKALCYAFIQLREKKGKNGKPLLPWTTKQTNYFISNILCELDGSSFNPGTVRTYLSPGKSSNRPKEDDEINLNDFNL